MTLYAIKSRRDASEGRASGQQEASLDALHHKAYPRQQSTSSGVPVHVDTPRGRQCAGYVVTLDGKRLLRKTRVKETHFCRKYRAFGVELEALRQAELLGACAVRLEFDDFRKVLEAPLSAFANDGIRDSLGGFGTQVFLPIPFWRDLSNPQGTLFGGAW
jgi:hypothetical protein